MRCIGAVIDLQASGTPTNVNTGPTHRHSGAVETLMAVTNRTQGIWPARSARSGTSRCRWCLIVTERLVKHVEGVLHQSHFGQGIRLAIGLLKQGTRLVNLLCCAHRQHSLALWAIVDLTHADDEAAKGLPQTFGALIDFLAPALEEVYCDLAEASQRCPCHRWLR